MGEAVNKLNGVFFTATGADEITGVNCNRSTFRWSVPTLGAVRQTIGPLLKQFPDAKRWYTITAQYLGGEAMLRAARSEEHTSELQSLMRISYAVFCLKTQKNTDKK